MPSWPSSNPVRTVLWFIRGGAILMLVAGLLAGQRLLSVDNAILVAGVVVSFIVEPRLLSHFATRSGAIGPLPPRAPGSRKFADAYFAFVVGSMRVIGGLFVAVGLPSGTIAVTHWSQSVRDYGGTTGAIGALLVMSAFVGLGTLLVFGRHVPVMRALREMGEQRRRNL
jgi:hypothetical protein